MWNTFFFFSFLSFVGRRRLRLKFYIRVYKTTRKWHAGVSEDVCYQTEEKPSSCSRLLNSNPKSTLRETGARGGFGNPTNIFILLSSVFFFTFFFFFFFVLSPPLRFSYCLSLFLGSFLLFWERETSSACRWWNCMMSSFFPALHPLPSSNSPA